VACQWQVLAHSFAVIVRFYRARSVSYCVHG